MDRLTHRDKYGFAVITNLGGVYHQESGCMDDCDTEILYRGEVKLADYEDTGLTPEDIKTLIADLTALREKLRILRPVELSGDAATSFALAAELSKMTTDRDAWRARAEAAEHDLSLTAKSCSTCARSRECAARAPWDGAAVIECPMWAGGSKDV